MTRRQRGDGKLSLFIFLAILAAAVFAAVKIIPPRVNAYEFRDQMTSWNTDPDLVTRRYTPEKVKEELLRNASELKLPIGKDQLKVTYNGDRYLIDAVFDVNVDLKVYTYRMHFDFHEPKS